MHSVHDLIWLKRGPDWAMAAIRHEQTYRRPREVTSVFWFLNVS